MVMEKFLTFKIMKYYLKVYGKMVYQMVKGLNMIFMVIKKRIFIKMVSK